MGILRGLPKQGHLGHSGLDEVFGGFMGPGATVLRSQERHHKNGVSLGREGLRLQPGTLPFFKLSQFHECVVRLAAESCHRQFHVALQACRTCVEPVRLHTGLPTAPFWNPRTSMSKNQTFIL